MAAEGAVTMTGAAPAEAPYLPSWIDRLIGAIERLPCPPWLFYAVLLPPLVLVINIASWFSGVPEYRPWTFDPFQSGYAVYPVYMLALMHYLNSVAAEKVGAFRPALDVDQREFERLRYELTTLPARETVLVTLLAVGFVAFLFAGDWIVDGPWPGTPAFVVAAFTIQGVTFAILGALIYHTIHQLRLVSRMHALAPRIDLFQPVPLYAFSHLTARTGLGLALLIVYSWLIDPRVEPIGVGLTAIVVGVAAAAFVLPLQGMHRRIVAEKEHLQLEADQRFKASLAVLHRSVDSSDLSNAENLNSTLDSLKIERDAIAELSTWPWERGTLRGFVSLLLVPVVLWLIFRVLERLV